MGGIDQGPLEVIDEGVTILSNLAEFLKQE